MPGRSTGRRKRGTRGFCSPADANLGRPPQGTWRCTDVISSKRVLLFVLAAVLAFGLATGGAQGSAKSNSSAAKKYRIAVILPDFTANELILDQKNGAVAAGKKYGVTLLITGSGSAETQVKAVQD